MAGQGHSALITLDYHVLLAMAEAPKYGYAIKAAVEVGSFRAGSGARRGREG